VIETLFPADVIAVEATAEMAEEPLHSEEAASTGRMSSDRLREFALGRACARAALGRLGAPLGPVLRGDDRAPVWPPGVVGSLSHCEGFCGVVVARQGAILGLGLDVERDAPLSTRAAERICTPAERDHLAGLPGRSVEAWAKLVFSAKESFYKCYYPLARKRLGFRDAAVRIDPEAQRFAVELVREDAPAAAGARHFTGHFRLAPPHVLTGVTLVCDSANARPDPDLAH
jgi:4'-phosphopantetheinyl transferase EntD